MPRETPTRWTARIPSMRSSEKYCRVEVEGSRIEDEPIALVKEARLAVAIAALPDLAAALEALVEEVHRLHLKHGGTALGITYLQDLVKDGEAALAKMEGK